MANFHHSQLPQRPLAAKPLKSLRKLSNLPSCKVPFSEVQVPSSPNSPISSSSITPPNTPYAASPQGPGFLGSPEVSDQQPFLTLTLNRRGQTVNANVNGPKTSEDLVGDFFVRLVNERYRYIGIYGPGDYNEQTYRIVLPKSGQGRGRGYRYVREEVVLETDHREDIDHLIFGIQGPAGMPNGPVAVRHIVNPVHGKDEGFRLVWEQDPRGHEEMKDWARRDASNQCHSRIDHGQK